MRIVSSAPCTVPSSPKRPCNAMKMRWKPWRLRSKSSRSAGSNAAASTRFDLSAASTAFPERSEISRSADGPPMSTATLPNCFAMASRSAIAAPLAHDAHLEHQVHAVLREHRRMHVFDDRLDVGGGRVPEVHDEVGVLRRDLRPAHCVALEAARFDQARGVVARRIAEDASRVGLAERLRGDAP